MAFLGKDTFDFAMFSLLSGNIGLTFKLPTLIELFYNFGVLFYYILSKLGGFVRDHEESQL